MPSLLPSIPLSATPWRFRLILLTVILTLLLLLLWIWNHRFGQPEDFDHMEAQYKYGSIGADHPMAQAPLPYWLWKVLPEVFPPATTIPDDLGPHNRKPGYETFGLVVESNPELPRDHVEGQPSFERPIGFSRRRVMGMDFVGVNCAFCHTGTYKASKGGPRQVVLGGTGNAVDIEQYFLFLFSSMTSKDFTADKVMPAVERELVRQKATLPWFQRALYRYVIIPVLPQYLAWMQKEKFDFIYPANAFRLPEFGPGRVDTWGLYKRVFVDPPQNDSIAGISDFPSLWNQKARAGMRMHWDGNTDVLIERNVVSALSLIGKRIEYLDFDGLERVTDWIGGLLPPRYADRIPQDMRPKNQPAIDVVLSQRGQTIFSDQCSACHSQHGDRIGRVEPIEDLGTDAERIAEFTPELRDALNKLTASRWQLRNFKVQNGYVNTPLDGLWLRAPYLHNGSVPTMRDLLNPPEQRPVRFCRGGEVYDWKKLGYYSDLVSDGKDPCPGHFLYDTHELKKDCKDPDSDNGYCRSGNSNKGHLYGTSLSDADKDALMEFLKTL